VRIKLLQGTAKALFRWLARPCDSTAEQELNKGFQVPREGLVRGDRSEALPPGLRAGLVTAGTSGK